jgi:hypothetical protein
MRVKIHPMTQKLLAVLVALSTLAVIVTGQQYLILRSEKEILLARRTMDESFLSAIKAAGGESNSEIAQQLARKKMSIESSYSAQAAMLSQLEIRALADMIAWCVVLVISGVALILNGRKQHMAGVSSSMPPRAVE